jgi:hypothetical protein
MLNIKKFNSYAIALILLLIIIALLFKMCSDAQERNEAVSTISQLLKDKSELQVSIDEMGREIAKKEVITIPQILGDSIKENESLDVIETKVIFKTLTRRDTIKVHLIDTFIVEQADTFKVKAFQFNDGWVAFGGKVDSDTLTLDSLIVSNAYNIEMGKERKWRFGKQKRMVYIRNENPHTSTKDVTSFQLPDDKKWYQKDAVKYGVGGLGMFLILR